MPVTGQKAGLDPEGSAAAGGCLTFVRGVTPERVIEGFGMDPGSARLVDADLAEARAGTASLW
jgi:hypothetical protein